MSKNKDLIEPMLTVPDIAAQTKSSRTMIYELIYAGRLGAINLQAEEEPGKRSNWRIPVSSWNKYVEENLTGVV